MGIGGSMGSIGGVSYDIIINDETKSGADSAIENFQRIDEQSILTVSNLAKIAAAFAALTVISATAVAASDRVVDLERATAHAAVTQGVSTRAMYEHVQSLSNADDSQDEIADTMTYLSRVGLRLTDDLESVYLTMDLIGDAVDRDSAAIARELIPAFLSLGLTAQDIAKYADILTYAYQHSLFEIGDWALMIRRNGESLLEYNVLLEDTIAISMRLSNLGIPQLQIRTLMNEAFKELGANAAIAAKGEEELAKIQEKLNELQEKGSKTTKEYLEDVLDAGNDLSKIRELTKAHNRQVENDAEEKKKILKEQADLQDKIDIAKKAPTLTLPEALAKVRPEQISEKDLTESIAEIKIKSVGAAAEYAPAGEIVTGTEIAKYNMDQLMQNTIGKNIDAQTAASMVHLTDISRAMTVAVSTLAIIQGLSAVTAASTSATALTSGATTAGGLIAGMNALLAAGGLTAAGAVGGGLLLGGGVVYGMESAGLLGLTGKGAVRSAGETFMDILTGDVGNAYLAEYLRTHNGQYPPGYDPGRSGIKEYAEGGIVPGTPGQPQLAIVHGGETISSLGAGGSFSLTINGGVHLSKDYDYNTFMRDVAAQMKIQRIQAGVRTAQ